MRARDIVWPLLGLCFCVASIALSESPDPVLAAYFIEWGVYDRDYHVTNLPVRVLSHVLYAFAEPVYHEGTDSGSLEPYDSWAATGMSYPGDDAEQPPFRGSFNQLVKLKQQHPHIRTLIAVGGWTLSADFSDIAASTNGRKTFVDSCVHFVTNYDFDGIDIDWEYPVQGGDPDNSQRPEDTDNLVLLVSDLRAALDTQESIDGNDYLLTIATSADPATLTNRFHLAAMAPDLDWVGIMAYDMTGPWDSITGHNAQLYPNPFSLNTNLTVSASVVAYLAAGAPAAKLVLGLPYYGRGFAGVSAANHGLFQSHTGASPGTWEAGFLDFEDLDRSYINTNGYTRYHDGISRVPWLYNPTSQVFVTYDDAASIWEKVSYAVSNDLAGVMCWSIDADTPERTLQQTAYRAFHPPRFSGLHFTNSPAGYAMAWDGLAGEEYTVELSTNLLDSGWTNCLSLVNTGGVPILVVIGGDGAVTVIDANLVVDPQRFYRVVVE